MNKIEDDIKYLSQVIFNMNNQLKAIRDNFTKMKEQTDNNIKQLEHDKSYALSIIRHLKGAKNATGK